MPRINFILCSGVFIVNAATLVAQTTQAYQSFTKATQYQFQQQKQWQLKQLPSNSVLYKFNSNHIHEIGYNFSTDKKNADPATYQARITASSQVFSFYSRPGTMMPSELKHYLQANQSKYLNWQKQAWWKDPSRGFGASLLKDYLQGNKSLLHL